MIAYLLMHRYESLTDTDEVKIIGAYTTKENALAAIERLSKTPGFCDHLSGFSIDEYPMDKDHWIEGFGIGD